MFVNVSIFQGNMGPKFKVHHLQVVPKYYFIGIAALICSFVAVTAIPPGKNNTQISSQSNHFYQDIKPHEVNTTSTSDILIEPLRKIFPSNIHTKPLNSSGISEDPDEILRKALINHTLAHGGKGDLDKLIFSSIPEGSKLVLQTVKVMRTDANGNPIPGSETDEPVHWDVSLTNDTDIVDEYEDDNSEDESQENQEDQKVARESVNDKASDTDLAISGSHSQANYKAYGNSEREKEKSKKYYHGNDDGKTHKVTHTDTDGVKLKKYKGTEKGLTDYDHSKGDSINKESERFRDTKRKNKGRRVSGFKRVYHKEEFQRTEHFFDDEEAKRIAESHGLKDLKEQSNHGTKGDDRKYHGVRKEHTDGNKLKNEHGTSKGYNKGQLIEYKDSEKHKHGSHYDKSQHSPNYNNGHYQQQQKQYHPNHNYHGSYSQPRNTIRRPNYSSSDKNNNLLISSVDVIGSVAQAPMIASFTVTPYEQDSSTDSSTDGPTVVAPSSTLDHHYPHDSHDLTLKLYQPDEMRTFFSPRERPHSVSFEYSESPTYAPSFKPSNGRGQRHHTYYHQPKYRNTNFQPGYPKTPFHNKIGNASLFEDSLRNNYTNYYRNNNGSFDRERYARNYPTSTVRNTIFGLPPGPGNSYSTLVKVMPVKYINLTDSGQENETYPQQSVNSNQIESSPESNYNSSNYKNMNTITFTTNVPHVIRRPPPPRGHWFSITLGNPDAIRDEHRHPNHNYAGYSSIQPLSNLVQGVKNKLMQPILRSAYPRGNRFDPSKYPPNVVQNNVNSYSTIPFIPSAHNVNQKPNPHRNAQHRPAATSGILQAYQPPYQNNNNNNNGNLPYSFKGAHRPRVPHTIPPFMNNLMDSVANFFSRMSNKESGG